MGQEPEIAVETKERLIEAACEVFGERGYRRATVRDICRKAGCNAAAVNYHFGDKDALYALVLERTAEWADEDRPILLDGEAELSAAARLRVAVQSYMERLFATGRGAWHDKLMSNEMMDPTEALDKAIETLIRPKFNALMSIISELLGEKATDLEIRLYSINVVGLCMNFQRCRPAIEQLIPGLDYGYAGIDMLAELITRYSLAAMKDFRNS